MQVRRSHFKEKDSTSVFHELSNCVQLHSESELDFCLQVTSLCQCVMSLLSEEDCPFNEELARKRFFYILSTRFKHNNIRLEPQNVLKTGTLTDEDLLKRNQLNG